VYYGSYEGMKWAYERGYHYVVDKKEWKYVPRKEVLDPFVFFTLGGLAEVTAASFFVPLGLICGRLQIQGQNRTNSQFLYKNGRNAVQQIWKHEGLIGFYRGFGSSLARDVPASAISWLCYEYSSRYLSRYFQRRRKVIHSLNFTEHIIATLSGLFSGLVTAVMTNPLQLASVLIQVQPHHDQKNKKYRHGWHALVVTIKDEGLRAMWKGTLARILTLAPSCGFGFTLFEFTKKYSRIES